jgi:hypothetical protein
MWAEEHDELDRILNRALSTYPEEPRLGLEARILRRVQNEGLGARWTGGALAPWSRALGGVVLVAALAAGIVWFHPEQSDKPASSGRQAAEGRVPQSAKLAQVRPTAGATQGNRKVEIRARIALPRLPKLDVFPTPSPLTPEELAFVKIPKSVPSATPPQSEKADTVQLEPIQIQALEIKPLAVDGDDSSE